MMKTTSRTEKGRRIARTPGAVRRLNREVYAVAGDSGGVYLVRLEEEICECKDHEYRGASRSAEDGTSCKHLIAVEIFVAAERIANRSRRCRATGSGLDASVKKSADTSDGDPSELDPKTRAEKLERSRSLFERSVAEAKAMSEMLGSMSEESRENFFKKMVV